MSERTRTLILIVEDDEATQNYLRTALHEHDGYDLLQARTLAEGERLFLKHQASITAVTMDGCLGSREPNSMPLIALMRSKGFSRPIVAASSLARFNEVLLKAGCDEAVEKPELLAFLRELLRPKRNSVPGTAA